MGFTDELNNLISREAATDSHGLRSGLHAVTKWRNFKMRKRGNQLVFPNNLAPACMVGRVRGKAISSHHIA
jgi:hypothetical protein